MDIYADKIGIYKILQKSTGCAYVGRTGNSFKKRYWIHNWGLSTGVNKASLLQAAFNDTGTDDFIFLHCKKGYNTIFDTEEIIYFAEISENVFNALKLRGMKHQRKI